MGDRKHVTDNKMSVTDINDPLFAGRSASRMARDLIRKFHRGPGDTIDAAAHRAQTAHRVDADTLMQGWNRPPRGMLTHRWLPLFMAWCDAGFAAADQAFEEERARHAGDDDQDISALVRLADLVAGRTSKPKIETETGVSQ